MMISQINEANDIKKLPVSKLDFLAGQIRELIIDTISKSGGHLASNLGTVELTMALHYLMDFPEDKLIFDVGHQSYAHKILTGRRESFGSIRQKDGITGFPNPEESDADPFYEGHASTAISEGVGLAQARKLLHKSGKIAVVVGDGALTGGIAFEALNNASRLDDNLTIVLNDNEMSISENVGGISSALSGLRTSLGYTGLKDDVVRALERLPLGGDHIINSIRKTKRSIKQLMVKGMIFEDMDILYLGPVNGHDIPGLIKVFSRAFRYKGACVVHVITKKGKGYIPAMKRPDRYHGVGPFDKKTGELKASLKGSFTEAFSKSITKLAGKDDRIVAITAAMKDGMGLKSFAAKFPERFFDVGIAEEHGVLIAAALAKEGLKPVFAVYSSFLQRGIDQIMINVCLNNLPVIFAIDRAGIVGEDGATHNGLFDISYLSMMPGLCIMSPATGRELHKMMELAVDLDEPCAIRYPKASCEGPFDEDATPLEYGKFREILPGKDLVILSLGGMLGTAGTVRENLLKKGYEAALVDARFVKPLDRVYLEQITAPLVVTLEENVHQGGFGMQVESALMEKGYDGRVISVCAPDEFVPHGTTEEIKELLSMDPNSITQRILEALG